MTNQPDFNFTLPLQDILQHYTYFVKNNNIMLQTCCKQNFTQRMMMTFLQLCDQFTNQYLEFQSCDGRLSSPEQFNSFIEWDTV